ncbi:MAG: superoxide dismutase family protein [Hyphomonadaceae bacterium]|nr:superoxide dismutase family protein [Clostridia bacterium]
MYPYPYFFTPAENQAIAYLKGSTIMPNIRGKVTFEPWGNGTRVTAEVYGLPPYSPASEGKPQVGPFGFHMHDMGNCAEGDPNKPFMGAGEHFNPTQQPHGNHAGDFPVLFSNHGFAKMCFYTDKFQPQDIIGKSVMIHQSPDDYRTQPAGDSGKRIACGVIQ